MSIKAKTIDKGKAAAFDRGLFGDAPTTASSSAGRRSYYYEQQRRYVANDASLSDSSSSSASRSRSISPAVASRQGHAGAGGVSSSFRRDGESEEEMSDDEEVVKRARAATEALWGRAPPARAAAAAHASAMELSSTSHSRLETYLRARAGSMPSMVPTEMNPHDSTLPHRANVLRGEAEGSKTARRPNRAQEGSPSSETPAEPHGGTDTASAAPSPLATVEKALDWETTNPEFRQLMSLIAKDVQQETCVAVTPDPAQRIGEIIGTDKPHAETASSAATTGLFSVRTYAPPPRTFAALEDNALERLYEDWCHQRDIEGAVERDEGDVSTVAESDATEEVFIAADHRAAAFSLAAVAAHDSMSALRQLVGVSSRRSDTALSAHPVDDAPFSWEELLQSEITRRNVQLPFDSEEASKSGLLSDPATLAEQATRRLRRFFQSVACVERLVRDRRFMRSVAVFLYEHHRVFFPHYCAKPSSPGNSTVGSPSADDHQDGQTDASAIVEHSHAELKVYVEFGERVSEALLSLLTRFVPGFDEAEFVEMLYDTPAAHAEEEETPYDDGAQPASSLWGPQSVLSFPAWRLLLAMSGFESFFEWMMDYINEEYHLDRGVGEGDAANIAVAGSRGLRALIRSTYNRPNVGASMGGEGGPAGRRTTPPDVALAEKVPGRADCQGLLDSRDPLEVSRPLSQPQQISQSLSSSLPQPLSASPLLRGGIPVGEFSSSSTTGSGVPLRKVFPTPPSSAEGLNRGMVGSGAPPYRKRPTTHPGRDLPPILPSANSLMPSNSGAALPTLAETSSKTTEYMASPTRILQDAQSAVLHSALNSAHAPAPAALSPSLSTIASTTVGSSVAPTSGHRSTSRASFKARTQHKTPQRPKDAR